MDSTNGNNQSIRVLDIDASLNDTLKSINSEEHTLLEQNYSNAMGYTEALVALELFIQQARGAREVSNKEEECSNLHDADEILIMLEAEFKGVHKGEDNDPYITFVLTKAALLRKRFNVDSCTKFAPDSLLRDIEIFDGLTVLWSLAFRIQDTELRDEVAAWANEMIWLHQRSIEICGKDSEHTQNIWDGFRKLALQMKQEIEQSSNIEHCAKVDAEEIEDETPNWLGEEGYEDQTMKWLSWKEQVNEMTAKTDYVTTKADTTRACNNTNFSSYSRILRFSFTDTCSCGKECHLARLPPIPEDGEDILTTDELQYRDWAVQNERQNQEAVNCILERYPRYKATLGAGFEIDRNVYEYAFEIAALAKGKSPVDREIYGNENIAFDLETPADHLYLGLKFYYLSLFRNMKRNREFEVSNEVLEIVQGLILLEESSGNADIGYNLVENEAEEGRKLLIAGVESCNQAGTAGRTFIQTDTNEFRESQTHGVATTHEDKPDTSSAAAEARI